MEVDVILVFVDFGYQLYVIVISFNYFQYVINNNEEVENNNVEKYRKGKNFKKNGNIVVIVVVVGVSNQKGF